MSESDDLLPYVIFLVIIFLFWFWKVFRTHQDGKRISAGDTLFAFLISGGFFCVLVIELLRSW